MFNSWNIIRMVYGNKEMIEVLFMLKVEPTMFVELVF